MDEVQLLYDRWVSPVYLRFLHGNFCGRLLAVRPADDQSLVIADLRRCVGEVSVDVVDRLLERPEWRARLAGAWYAGLRGWDQWADPLGALLLASETCYAGQGYAAAMACFASEVSATYLARYLDIWLPRTDCFYDQHWAMPALLWVDRLRGTNQAAPYVEPGGPWDRWCAGRRRDGPAFLTDRRTRFDLTLSAALAGLRRF